MAARDELLKMLDPAIRARIENDTNYAPLLALMGAWKEEVEAYVSHMEQNTVTRLMTELFPKGHWRFPYQTLAVPEDLVRRDVTEEAAFTDRATQTIWTPCGPGHTLPTRLVDWRIEQQGFDQYALVCYIHMESRQPNSRLLTAPSPPEDPLGQTQLAFVCGSEAVVAELAGAAWAVQHPGESFLPITVTRYQGYLDFERGLGAARGKQRQLESWLPPFFPYGRKFLRFAVAENESNREANADLEAWAWLGNSTKTIRLAALISEQTADYFGRQTQFAPLILNAVPLAQMRAESDVLIENPDRIGDSFNKPFMGVEGCFAASVREVRQTAAEHSVTYHAACMTTTPSEDERSQKRLQDVNVLCDRPSASVSEFRVRIYKECFGEGAATPNLLTRPNGLIFKTPFPPLGSMDAEIVDYDDPGARRSWYHSLLRAPQLTEGDVLEILGQIPDCRKYLELDPNDVSIQLDIENTPQVERTPWDNYLWPCLVSDSMLLEQRATYLTASRVPVIPVMNLIFRRGKEVLPDFLQEDLVRYAASVISQYFMIGWYRVIGKWADG